jgi:hypothetical protein
VLVLFCGRSDPGDRGDVFTQHSRPLWPSWNKSAATRGFAADFNFVAVAGIVTLA